MARPATVSPVTTEQGVLDCVWCGDTVPYAQGLAWQDDLVRRRAADEIGDVVLVLVHERVYTAGPRADVTRHVLGTVSGVPLVHTDRGGDVTYHGPGQLVAYPIVRLAHAKAVRPYVAALEQACVAVAGHYGLPATPDPRRPGVWVGDDKLAAVGVRVRDRVTRHGLALNVTTDLADFGGLVPCGITDGGVTSLQRLGVVASVEQVREPLVAALAAALGRGHRWVAPAGLLREPAAPSADLR